ncbi:unnamed protein product [Strongylus vulgaris]|uniref:G-patch domain-containing protein n=1 Tax=Strongylus vulgaris TaxID=40348 RepID=A0A3P7J1H9_STRVU|nr:unnamed protein product [Strongylus vulgaris]
MSAADNRQIKLEKAIRDDALSKPVPETSKGFALMAKMGFKPGMSLGKKKDVEDLGSGIKEPIKMEVKVSRSGLGHDSEQEYRAKQRLKQEMESMKRRAEQAVELIDDYRKRKRGMSNTKDLIRDIIASRKVCVEMNIEHPKQSWFWKSYKKPTSTDVLEGHQRAGSPEDEDPRYFYANGNEAPEEERFDELSDEELLERYGI